jgi:hypothetical protein
VAIKKPRISDAELLTMLKSSGILKPDVTLDELVKLSEKLAASPQARGFIFRDFLYRPC